MRSIRDTYVIRDMGPGVRCHWVFDTDYQTEGSYGLATEAETAEAEAEERAKLDSGEWLALGCVVAHQCEKCGEWFEGDSCWGIVIEPKDETLDGMARYQMTLTNSPTCDRCHQAYLLESAVAYLKLVDSDIHGRLSARAIAIHLEDMAAGLRKRSA